MAKPKLLALAEKWMPKAEDPCGADQKRLIEFLMRRAPTAARAVRIETVIRDAGFERAYSKSNFQHSLLGPLRKDSNVFVGTSNRGIFLVTSPEDADQTLT